MPRGSEVVNVLRGAPPVARWAGRGDAPAGPKVRRARVSRRWACAREGRASRRGSSASGVSPGSAKPVRSSGNGLRLPWRAPADGPCALRPAIRPRSPRPPCPRPAAFTHGPVGPGVDAPRALAGEARPPGPAAKVAAPGSGRGLYLLRSGCPWRLLPREYPPWRTVYTQFRRWRLAGTLRAAHDRLRERVRLVEGRQPEPGAAILDSQMVKGTGVGGPARLRRREAGKGPQALPAG